ncbi:MAG: EAL domain-containing protein [Cyanobacteria bacterium J06626_4]
MANCFFSAPRVVTDISETGVATPASSRLRLLVVEDVAEDVELIALSLDAGDVDYEIQVADALEPCRQLLSDESFDAVLADYRLPGLQAPDVFRLVSEYQPLTPFILVTGSLGEEAAVDCIKTGMTDYVLKDRLYRLPTVLRRALDEAELKRQQQAAIAQVEQQAWRESIINRIVQAIRETLILEEVLQTTVDQLQAALEVSRCLFVQPTAHQSMQVQYASSIDAEAESFRFKFCQICLHYEAVLKAGQAVVLHQSDADMPAAVAEILRKYQLQSVLLTPLNYQKEFFGALVLHQNTGYRPWQAIEVSLIQTVAEQCAIAIYQSNLYAQAQGEIEQRRRIEEQLRHDAFHDALTGLPNRALFLDRLNHARQIARRNQDAENDFLLGSFAVLFLDLDDFRIVNDSLGHDAGDFLLQVVAARLGQCLRVGDTLARTSGDEFAILLEDIEQIEDILAVVENIQTVLKQSIVLESQAIFISSCIGIVIDAPTYNDAAQFLRDADTAMYQAKDKGRNSYQMFDGAMHTEVKQRLQLENDLRRAFDQGEFYLVYQPIVHLPSHQVCGFEALIRWHDPIRGLQAPDAFIPVAERTGLIIPIGQWVIQAACQQWRQWLQRWPEAMQSWNISINLSAKQFVQTDLMAQIEKILHSTGVDCRHLRVEITESALMENEITSLATLRQLKSKSIQVAMDDFGTGYSSLSYLLRFPNDVLKIDKSFVSHLDNNPNNQEIIKTILALGKNLDIEVVAEGIETSHQAQFLLEQGCVFGQGYWFSKPLTPDKAEAMLEAHFKDD